ncbi:MAG TPA: peptidyl-prolyl cis-trans isomerase [Rhizomicrobium sp.]|jgi:peptidyl-prolyl cis-trans isomerase D|nr:peptidyl-prolyl cis-trans isomerase [Rhizomicrobium sp.]
MLQEMRKYAKSWVSSIFLGGLALSFAVWGIADIFRGTPDSTVFTVGSTQVPVEQFARDFRNAQLNERTVLTPEESKLMGQQVLDRMTLGTALDNLAARLGLTASDARVRAQVQAITAFNGPLGSFDHDTFLHVINQHGYGEDEFIAVSRRDAARTQMLRAVEGGYQMPPDYARAIFAYINEARAADYVVLTPASLGETAPPDEAALAAYVKAHPERFSSPEYRTVSYAGIGVDDVASTISITDKQIQDEIDANKADYIVPEKRELEQISFKSEDDAKAAKAALDGGKTFDALAAERKLAAADYKLGPVVEADLDPARAAALFALPQGGVSAPVKSTFGWVLMHAAKITPGSAKSHDEVKLALQRKLAISKLTDMANAFTDALGGGGSIEEAARKAGMHYIHIAAIDAQGLAPDGSKPLAAAPPELLANIFKAEVGEEGDPFPTQDGHYYAIKVEGVTPPKVKPLDAVRAQAAAAWTAEQRQAQLRVKAAALAARANMDRSLAAVAASLGAPVQSSPALNRGSNTGLFSAAVVRALYEAPPGGTVFMPTADGGYIVARVTGVVHPVPPDGNLGYMRGVTQLSGEIASDVTETLAKAEQQREGMTINQKLVDSTVGNSGSGS